jgi:hypothetical protein
MNPLSPVLFLTSYTYSAGGQAGGVAGQRWFAGQAPYTPGSRTIGVALYETTGGVFDQITNPGPLTVPVGTAAVTFASCTSGRLQYDFTSGTNAGRSGTIASTRVDPVPPGCGPYAFAWPYARGKDHSQRSESLLHVGFAPDGTQTVGPIS